MVSQVLLPIPLLDIFTFCKDSELKVTLMNKQQAENIAREYLESEAKASAIPVEILTGLTIEKPYGWIFFFQSKRFLETGALSDMLVGNGPILVENSGHLIRLPTAIPVEEALKRYESGQPLLPRPESRKN